jgi:hypothetical protein
MCLVVLTAILVGLIGGTPFDHPDVVTQHTGRMIEHFGNPKFFNYPAFLIYLFGLLYGGVFLLLYAAGSVRTHGEFKALIDTGTLIEGPISVPVFLPGHVVIVLFSLLGLASVFCLTLRITGRRPAAVLALFATGLSLLWVSSAHMLTVDLPAAALVIATVGSYVAVVERSPLSYRSLLWPGILAGLATGTKYPSVLVVVALMVAELATIGRPARQRLARALFMGSVAVVTFVSTNPFILLDFRAFQQGLVFEFQHAARGHHGFMSTGLAHHLVESLGTGVGLPVLVGGMVGLGLFAVDSTVSYRNRLAVLLFPMLHMVLISTSRLGFHRYALPVVPYLAFGVANLACWLSRRARVKLMLIVGVCVMFVLWHAWSTVTMLRVLSGRDTRAVLAELVGSIGIGRASALSGGGSPYGDDKRQTARAAVIVSGFDVDRHVFAGCRLAPTVVRELQGLDTVLVINPFTASRSAVPFSPQSIYAPYPPDLEWRRLAGPYIEVYFDGARLRLGHREMESPFVSIAPAESGFYRQALTKECLPAE